MARTYTPLDGNVLMEAIYRQATGESPMTPINASNYISAGETVLKTGMENVYNALGMVMGRAIVAVRPLTQKFLNIQAIDSGMYTNRFRKISYYSESSKPSGAFNTDLYTNLKEGFTAGENKTDAGLAQSTKSQWEQNPARPLEMNFGGSTTWQECLTMYEEQIKPAFRDPFDMAGFAEGQITQHSNHITLTKEAFNRMIMLNKIVSCYYYDREGLAEGTAYNMTAAFNSFYGTTYSSAELRSTYLTEFLQFLVAFVKEKVDQLTEYSTRHHLAMTKTFNNVEYNILRHTPREMQRLYLYSPMFRMAEAMVYSSIFNPSYLSMDDYEGVTFWQSPEERPAVNFNGAVYDPATGEQKETGNISIPFVIGMLMDRDAAMTDFQLERVATTSIEARKLFRNTWLTISRNGINDPTENAILFYMQDEN